MPHNHTFGKGHSKKHEEEKEPVQKANSGEVDLNAIGKKEMLQRNLWPEFGEETMKEVEKLSSAEFGGQKDLRGLLWFSVDNDDSKDLDQLTYAERIDSGYKVFVSIADVTCLVTKGCAIDEHAAHNTTSVYTASRNYLMLPERLSTDLTSLNPNVDRLSMVVEMKVSKEGQLEEWLVQEAIVHNCAKLTYNRVGDWLEEKIELPEEVAAVKGLEEQIRLQDEIAQKLKVFREGLGTLTFETNEVKAVVENGKAVRLIEVAKNNRAQEIIENLMIAANTATTKFLVSKQFPTLRRVVKVPERWDRIQQLAKGYGFNLPPDPSSKALQGFLNQRKESDPQRFPDLSLTVIKLMGRGEYTVEEVGDKPTGHFALAIKDYTHSTAPNRRFTDLVTQRMLKAAIHGKECPYTLEELTEVADNCSKNEVEAEKVERRVSKSAIAMVFEAQLGETFDAIVTGASQKGTWVRLLHPPVEGKLVKGYKGLDVGDSLKVTLTKVDAAGGHIDFTRLKEPQEQKKEKTTKHKRHPSSQEEL